MQRYVTLYSSKNISFAKMTGKWYLILWILNLYIKKCKTTENSTLVRTPQLRLKAEITPKKDIVAGDAVTLSIEISHTKKSFAPAVDVDLSLSAPPYIVFGNYSSSTVPQNITRSRGELTLKFSSISLGTQVTVAMTTHVDPYYMLGSRDKVTTSCMVTLWYYGTLDSCGRPESKWNARSSFLNARFHFTANKVCEREIGLHESQFSASSFEKTTYNSLGNSPHRASFAHDLVWTPADTKDIHQYLQIEFNQLMRITKVGTKGIGTFVRKFVLYYSQDGREWAMAYAAFPSHEFEGNSDSTTVKMNILKVPVEAKLVRIVPKSWKDKIALKVQIFGCAVNQVPAGFQPLGISSGRVKDNKITVVSGNKNTYKPYHARLDFYQHTGGWCTPQNSKQTLVVDLEDNYVIAEIAVQSKYQTPDKLIKKFQIAYKKDGGAKTYFKESAKEKTFLGNPVEDTIIRHKFLDTILARHVYIEPKQLSNTGCLRLELYGYKEDEQYITDYCPIFDFESGSLTRWTGIGSAFNNQPTFFDNLHARTGHAVNHEGSWWIGTRENRRASRDIPGDIQENNPTGTLTSPAFIIASSKLFFMFAGTAGQSKSRIELLVDGLVARTAFSKSGNESLVQMSWNVKSLVGNEAQIRLVDSGSDAFVSFDGLKSNCNFREELLPVFERSFLLNRLNNTLYICHFSHTNDRKDPGCRLTTDNGQTWQDLSHVAGLLGINEVTGELYGISVDRRDRLVNLKWVGIGAWNEVTSSEWNKIKDNVNTVVEIPNIPITGLAETDDPFSVLTLTANSGDMFSASSLGVYHKSSGGGGWKIIATWRCKEYPDACVSSPCNNGGVCHVMSENGFKCTCPQGFTGDFCDIDVEDCEENSCLNGGECKDGFNKFFCVCKSFYTGERCEKNIDDCSTSPCSTGALCVDGLGNFTCQCPAGFAGEFCQLDTDECASLPCQHGGRCADGVDSYTCHCRRGYSGIHCEHVHATAFEVLSTESVVYQSSRYTVVHARLPADGRSRHQTWCHEYTALCHSLNKTRPTGCGRSSNHITEIHQCQTAYDSVMPHNDTLSCPPNINVSFVAKLAGYSNANPKNSFAFSKCGPSECTDSIPKSGCHGALHCINLDSPNREVYTLCTDPDSNFKVEGKGYTAFKGVKYLALYVKPLSASSRHENWCRDYQKLCQSYGSRPTGCGGSYSSNISYSSCQEEYLSVMPANNELGCENNWNLVASIGESAGLPATSSGFNFHICVNNACKKELPLCWALRCLGYATTVYHALCTQPLTSFGVLDERWTVFHNISWLVIKARLPRDRKSTQEDWCRDYATLCESYGLRPTGRDVIQDHEYTSCRDKYGSITIDGFFFGSTPKSRIASIAKQAGFRGATVDNSFGLDKCTRCPSVLTGSNCEGLGCLKTSRHSDVYTVCVKPQSSFEVLERKTTTYNNKAYLLVKAKVKEKDSTNWKEEYTKTCSRYGRRNVVCEGVPSSTPTPTSTYLKNNQTSSPDLYSNGTTTLKLDVVATSVGTHGTPALSSRTATPAISSSSKTSTHPIRIDVVATSVGTHGTPALSSRTATPAISSSSKTSTHPIQIDVVATSVGTHGTPALSNRTTPAISSSSKTSTTSNIAVTTIEKRTNQTEQQVACNHAALQAIALKAGFANDIDISISNSFGSKFTPSTDVLYLLCEGPDSNFDVISTKPVAVRGKEYLVIEARLPANGLARYENWCEDYKQLCLSHGQRPVAWGMYNTSSSSPTACRDSYDAMISGDSFLGCPSNMGVPCLANLTGYTDADASNSFAFSLCNETTCAKNFSNTMAFSWYAQTKSGGDRVTSSIGSNQPLYTMCVGTNSSFTVESSTNVSYQGGVYKIIKSRIPADQVSKQETWCQDYQTLCRSYGWRPVVTSQDSDVSCERNYGAISPRRDEVSTAEKLEHLVKIAGHENASVANIFAFRRSCKPSCFASVAEFSNVTEPAINVDSHVITQQGNVVFAICINSDTNFHVLDNRRINHQNRLYLVLKASIPSHGASKFENWCVDYQRLCGEHEMRPVSILTSESRQESCIPDYMSVVVPRDKNLTLLTREQVSRIANLAGYRQASRDTSFAFSECNPKSCPRLLDSKCAPGLDCLTTEPREVYTVCTDSNSNFKPEDTLSIRHTMVPYLLVRSTIPEHGLSRHSNWCLDYKNLCNSFGMRPVACENSSNPQSVAQDSPTLPSPTKRSGKKSGILPTTPARTSSMNSQNPANCTSDFATPSNACELKNIAVLQGLIDESFRKNSSVFMPYTGCDYCNKTFVGSCAGIKDCSHNVSTTLTLCTALQSHFGVLETKQAEHDGEKLSIVRTRISSNGSSFHKNWGDDYKKMCSSLGKRPFSCRVPGSIIQYKNREQYNIFLSDSKNCFDILTFRSLAIDSGFPKVKNILLFESSLTPTNELIYRNDSNPKKCCKCLNSSNTNTTLAITLQKNASFARTWRACVGGRLQKQILAQNCSVARDCLNDTRLAKNTCGVISNCYHNNCTECCACNVRQIFMSECPPGKKCLNYNTSEEIYAVCSDFSVSNFQVEDAREVMYADRTYTVVKAHVPAHGQSRLGTWCEDYKMLCGAIGKRPLGCGKDFEVLKRSRDCRIRYDAIMVQGISCPGSQEVTAIARHAGFPASANESFGLWNCESCSKNFSETWNRTNSSVNVYLLCAGPESNFEVLKKRVVKAHGSPVSVVMTTTPHHGESLHENWCLDYSRLCQSYGERPVGCGRSADNILEHAQCRDGYNALMFSDDSIDCSEKFNVHEIAQSAGFTHATSKNSIIFKSCLPQHCTKFLPSAEHPFTPLEVDPTDRVLYTLCASSDSAYDVIATKSVAVAELDYLVIRARIPDDGTSKHRSWCDDYERMCEGYGMKPLTCMTSSSNQRKCMYNFSPISLTNSDLACPANTGVAAIAKQAGFDNVTDGNSFALDLCDMSASCVAKMPHRECQSSTVYDSIYETNATLAEVTRADYILNVTNIINVGKSIIVSEERHCFIVPSGSPRYMVNGEKLTDVFKSNTCGHAFDSKAAGVILTYFNMTVNQTFHHQIPRVVTNCWFPSSSHFSRMSGETNTVCVQPGSDTNFKVSSTRTISSSGREYLIIQAKLLSAVSKSLNWCMEYKTLCRIFQASPLACPRTFGFNADYMKCMSNYDAIMMTDVDYACPSNGFVSGLARAAGYVGASLVTSFSLLDCNDASCTARLPITGCSDAVHCLSQELLRGHVYTACVVSNSDSNFKVVEKRVKRRYGYDYTVVRAQLPTDGAPLFDTWCVDYQRLCQSLNLRPMHCTGGGLYENEYAICKQKYSAVLTQNYGCPIKVQRIAWSAGYSGPSSKNSFAFHRCGTCSKDLKTSTCDVGLNCLTTNVDMREVYTICGGTGTKSSFEPLITKEVRHGHLRLRVIQAKVISQTSADSDWGADYRNLCDFYNELPTGCGKPPGESNPGVSACESKYDSFILVGNDLGCNPNDVISKLARDAGFVNARPSNSFAFSLCNGSSTSQLSSKCHGNLPCLTWTPENPIVYTVCVKKPMESNFQVLGAKSVTFNQMDYLVIHAEIPADGKSFKSNWCHDYQELCVSYNMLPTGCGGSSAKYSNYSSCSSNYGSYMPANDILGCGDTKIVSRIANKAGFTNAIPANSFVFHNCEQCGSELTDECDGALTCVSNLVWKRQVYTVCVNPTTAFNVRSTTNTVHNNTKYLVLEAKLPADGRAKSETWCRDYEKLCKSYNKRPLTCKDEPYMECGRKYTAKEFGFSCSDATKEVSKIALLAGFSNAKQGNTFIFSNCNPSSCSKVLASSGCDSALSCINSNPSGFSGYVYAVCGEDTSNFKVLDSRKVSISGDAYTVVSALLSENTRGTWCKDYSELCHAVGQNPVALHSGVVSEQLLKCRDEYDAVMKMSDFDVLHQIANQAGYSQAMYGNTFAFKGCSYDSCQANPYSFNCSNSLHCLNGERSTRTIYGLCIENTHASNFYVLENKTFHSNDTTYAVFKVRIPLHRLSKFETWCRDYERLCHAHSRRPLASLSSLGCRLDYFSIFASKFDARSLTNIVRLAGFPNATTGSVYSLQKCDTRECPRQFEIPHCVQGACTTNQHRVFYAVCGSLDEKLWTNFEVQDVRKVWLDAAFLVAQVRIPSHKLSKTENWCLEYQTFCRSYDRQPYTSRDISTKRTFLNSACSWKYNATTYSTAISPAAVVERAGFNASSPSCVSTLYDCTYCGKKLDREKCPFKDCQATVGTCDDFYIICT